MNQAESKIYTIVLGSGITERNKPGFDGKLRSIALIELLKQDPNRRVIFSGGKTAGQEYLSEARAMEKYARTLLRAASEINFDISIEEEALDTVANLENSLNLIDQQQQGRSKIEIITNYYHLQRVRELCERLNINAEIIEAEKLVVKRSNHHKRLIKKREMSIEMGKLQAMEKILILLNKFPLGREVIKMLAEGTRR